MPEQPAAKKRNFRSLTVTIAAAFLVLSFVILLITTGLQGYSNYQNQQKVIADQQKIIAQGAADTVRNYVVERISTLKATASLGNLAVSEKEQQKATLEKLLRLEPSFRQVILLDPRGAEVTSVSRLSVTESNKLTDQDKNEILSFASTKKTYTGPVFIDGKSSEPMMIVAVPVTDVFGDFRGVLVAEANLKFMWDLVGSMQVGKSGTAYVVDGQGNLIASGDISRVLKGENILSVREVNQFVTSKGSLPEYNALVSKGLQGNDVVANYVPLGTPDWAVVVELPVDEVYQPLYDGLYRSAAILLISLLLATVSGIFLSTRITKPLILLRNATREISKGNLDTRVEIESASEIGELAASFNKMTGDLQKTTVSKNYVDDVLKSMFDMLIVIKPDNTIRSVNKSACDVLGYPAEELVDQHYTILLPREDVQHSVAWREELTRTGIFNSTDVVFMTKTGRKIPVVLSASVMHDTGGSIQGIVAVAHDITEQKRAEDALIDNEAKFRSVFEGANEAIFIADRSVFLECNHSTEVIFGCLKDKILGHSPADFSPEFQPDGRRSKEISREKIDAALAGKPQVFYWVHLRYDGTPFDADVTLNRVLIKGEYFLQSIVRDITERKKAEAALQKSQYLLWEAMDMAHMAEWEFDIPTSMFTFNDQFYSLYGTTAEREGGYLMPAEVYLRNFVHPEDRNMVKEQENNAITSTDPAYLSQIEHRFIRRDGEVRHILVRVRLDKDAEGRTIKTHGSNQDITDRKLAEQELRESEERYSALFSRSYTIALLIDPDTGQIVDANDAAVKYYRYPREQLLEKGIYDLNRLSRDKVVQDLIRAKDKQAKHFQSVHYRADGEKRYVEVYSGPIHVRNMLLFYSIIHDITESRFAAQALRESEERYRTLVDRLPDYVVVHRDGILLYANPAAAARFGYAVEEIIGKPILMFFSPEYHDAVKQAMVRRMAGEEFLSHEMKILAKDGTFRTVLANGATIVYEGRTAILNVLSDITALKEAEETIRRANEELEKRVLERTEELSKANVRLTAEIAARTRAEAEITRSLDEKVLLLREIHHRVKNNLQIIASLLKLQSRTITDPNVLEAIRNSQSRIRAMALVHERIYRSTNLSEINVKDYLDYLTKQIFQFYNIQQNQIKITVTMPDIMADIDTITPLGLIINELVSNSLKHAFPEGRKGSISIECMLQEGGLLRIVYHDSGIGMPPLFDWKNTESLGLRLVNSLVDQLNGTIESGTGAGTTFIITIQQVRESSAT